MADRLLLVLAAAALLAACGKDGDGNANAGQADVGDMGTEDVFVPLDWGDSGPGFDVGPLQEQILPIEVLGAGAEATVELRLDDLPAEGDIALELRVHNVSVVGGAELEINGAYNIDLAEDGGPFYRANGETADGVVNLDVRQLRQGTNYFIFRWTADSADVVGFRVVGFALKDADDGTIYQIETWDDPSTWVAPDSSDEAIERGRRYFQNVSPGGGNKCADCHTTSGSDLAYYAYSDEAIIGYAQLLGYDATEASDLTSYIRSLDVGRDGRPWVSPFQPGVDNYGAAGAPSGPTTDAQQREAWLGTEVPATIEWDHAAGYDPYLTPSTIWTPTWNRWLPRSFSNDWFGRAGNALDSAIGAYEEDPNIDTAHDLLTAAVAVANELSIEGLHAEQVDVMKWVAVKLWDWSRQQSFYEDHHGFPDEPWGMLDDVGSPDYIGEVGFALADAAGAGLEGAQREAVGFWLAQVATNYGRGRSTGLRPVDYSSLLTNAAGIVGPNEMAWLYVLGSWEESRGALIDLWGSGDGPVRLLPAALPHVPVDLLPLLWRRFVEREADHAIGGGMFTPEHLSLFQRAWEATCADLDDNTREQLVAQTPDALRDSIICPP